MTPSELLGLQPGDLAEFPSTHKSLVERARDGESEARNQLAQLYRGPLLAFLRGRGEPLAEAEDIVQIALERILVRPAVVERVDFNRGKFRNLVLGVAKNVLREHRPHEGAPQSLDPESLDRLSWTPDRDEAFDMERAKSIATFAMDRLRERHPAEAFVFDLRAAGKTYSEIVETYSAGPGRVPRAEAISREFIDNRYRRAKELLRRAVAERILMECDSTADVEPEIAELLPLLAKVWPFPTMPD